MLSVIYAVDYKSSKQAIDNYIVSEGYKQDICIGIVMENSGTGGKYSYSLMYNSSSLDVEN